MNYQSSLLFRRAIARILYRVDINTSIVSKYEFEDYVNLMISIMIRFKKYDISVDNFIFRNIYLLWDKIDDKDIFWINKFGDDFELYIDGNKIVRLMLYGKINESIKFEDIIIYDKLVQFKYDEVGEYVDEFEEDTIYNFIDEDVIHEIKTSINEVIYTSAYDEVNNNRIINQLTCHILDSVNSCLYYPIFYAYEIKKMLYVLMRYYFNLYVSCTCDLRQIVGVATIWDDESAEEVMGIYDIKEFLHMCVQLDIVDITDYEIGYFMIIDCRKILQITGDDNFSERRNIYLIKEFYNAYNKK